MRKGLIVFSVLMVAVVAADASAQMGSRRGSGRVGPDRAAKAQEKPQNSVDQLALILAELQEDLKLTANQQAAWDAYVRDVEALASDVARERDRTKEVMQMKVLQRLDHAVDVARDRLTAVEDIAAAAKKLHAGLTPEQQSVADPRLATAIAAAADSGTANSGIRSGPPEARK
ncbi:MAG TPA: Spy/CpxP family protein refolding chaperone [Burkholderiales bacterium]|nr:Spy/CpxP family protein refolding chaperone [Burkholderiales bacterium]